MRQLRRNCTPKQGITVHPIFTDDSYNILMFRDQLFPELETPLNLLEALDTLKSWAFSKYISDYIIPIDCFQKGKSLYYIFRIVKSFPSTTENNKKDKIWAIPSTAMMFAKTPIESDVIKETFKTLGFPYIGRPYLESGVIFPEDPNEVTVVNSYIGGSTGAKLVRMTLINTDQYYVMKIGEKYGISSRYNHLKEECLADIIYMEFGVPVSHIKIYNYDDKIIKLSSFLRDGTPIQNQYEKEMLKQHFIVDAFLANWDVIGSSADNILVYNGIPVRIDNGGSLRYRAQGQPKGDTFSNEVNEIFSMRCKGPVNSPFCNYFEDLTDEEVVQQIITFTPLAKKIVTKLYDMELIDPELKEILEQRIAWLNQWSAKK